MSLPFDVTIFKRCPKSRQVHARINPLDLIIMLPEVILREGPTANKDPERSSMEIREESSGT